MALRSPEYDQLPTAARPERTGESPVERMAVAVVRREIASMPASLVVQLALWPDDVAHWAREERVSESLVYNMLAARKPYARTRARLADRLGLPAAVVDHLVESRRPQPTSRRGPGPANDDRSGLSAAADPNPLDEPWPAIDWSAPPWPRHRDGTNPIERRAVRCVEVDVASMAAATVVGLAIWPETLAEWSRRERLKSSVVWATLSGSPSAPVRDALARRLGVALRDLDALVTLARRVPVSRRVRADDPLARQDRELSPGAASDARLPTPQPDEGPPVALPESPFAGAPAEDGGRSSEPAPPVAAQLELGF